MEKISRKIWIGLHAFIMLVLAGSMFIATVFFVAGGGIALINYLNWTFGLIPTMILNSSIIFGSFGVAFIVALSFLKVYENFLKIIWPKTKQIKT